MNKEEFESQIIVADRDLRQQGFSVAKRAHKMLNVFSPNSSFLFLPDRERKQFSETEYSGQDLYDKIQSWYVDHYGDRSQMYMSFRALPIILLDDIYLFRLPHVYGTQTVRVDLLGLIDEFTPLTSHLLTETEVVRYKEAFQEGYSLSLKIDNMHTSIRGADKKSRVSRDPFIVSAERDRKIAVRSLTSPHDCNNAIFHSQQFAEKMIKSLLFTVEEIEEDEIRVNYGHGIKKLWKKVKASRNECSSIDSSVSIVDKIKMDVRYSLQDRPISDAVATFWEALRIASFCAEEIREGYKRHPC